MSCNALLCSHLLLSNERCQPKGEIGICQGITNTDNPPYKRKTVAKPPFEDRGASLKGRL